MALMSQNRPEDDPAAMQPMIQHPMHALVAPLGAPPPPPAMMGMEGNAPDLSQMSEKPKGSPMSPTEQYERQLNKRLMGDYEKDANPYGSPTNHPGKMGKVLHALSFATGGPGRRFLEEQQLGKQVEGIDAGLSKEALESAQAGEAGARQGLTEEQTKEMPEKTKSEENLQSAEAEHARNPPAATPEMDTYRSLRAIGYSAKDALAEIEKDKQLGLKPPNMQAKTLDVPGKGQVAGKVDSQGNLLLADGTPAPAGTKLYQQPNYGELMLPTKTATFIGPDGVPREYQWDPATQTYDKPIGISASNAYGHEVAQAGAVARGGEQLIQDLEANRDKLGNLSAWVQKYGLNTPIADPALAGIQAELKTFAALQPAMHGFRSRSAQEAFENIIGDLQKNPDATIASIRGILKTAGSINPDQKTEQPPRPNGVPPNAHYITDPKTGKKGWAW